MRRYSSGQRGQTVNLLALAYEGSNPSRRTLDDKAPFGAFSNVRREVQLSERKRCTDSKTLPAIL